MSEVRFCRRSVEEREQWRAEERRRWRNRIRWDPAFVIERGEGMYLVEYASSGAESHPRQQSLCPDYPVDEAPPTPGFGFVPHHQLRLEFGYFGWQARALRRWRRNWLRRQRYRLNRKPWSMRLT